MSKKRKEKTEEGCMEIEEQELTKREACRAQWNAGRSISYRTGFDVGRTMPEQLDARQTNQVAAKHGIPLAHYVDFREGIKNAHRTRNQESH